MQQCSSKRSEPVVVDQGQAEVSGLAILQSTGFLLIKLDGAHHGADLIHQHTALPVSHLPCSILLHFTSLCAQLQLLLEQLHLCTTTNTCSTVRTINCMMQ